MTSPDGARCSPMRSGKPAGRYPTTSALGPTMSSAPPRGQLPDARRDPGRGRPDRSGPERPSRDGPAGPRERDRSPRNGASDRPSSGIRLPERQARLSRLIRQPTSDVIGLGRVDATNVGRLLAASGTSDIADAHVVICSRPLSRRLRRAALGYPSCRSSSVTCVLAVDSSAPASPRIHAAVLSEFR